MKSHILQVSSVTCICLLVILLSVDGNPVEKAEGNARKDQDPKSGDIDLSKPGTCPSEQIVSKHSLAVCTLDCLFDLECSGTMRCCPDSCGGAACIETTENEDKSSTIQPATETITSPARASSESADSTTPEPTVSATIRTRTAEATASSDNNAESDLHLDGDAVVNVSVVVGKDLVLHCNISTTGSEPLLFFWMVQTDGGFLSWSDVTSTDNKRVSHGGAWLEILGATLQDSQSFVCFGGHSIGYLTQTYMVTVTEKPETSQGSPPDSCANDACMNGGSCIEEEDHTYHCVCPDGYQGEGCTEVLNPCGQHPNICQNGATCVAADSHFSCKCAPDWEGVLCQDRVSACRSSPCLNGGECVDLVDTFRCVCPPKFSGLRCKEKRPVTTETSREETTLPPTTVPMSDACYLPLDMGTCSRKETKWYYDTETEQCRPFVYNGCRGNANRFSSYDNCHWECPRLPADPCAHPIVTGRCKAMIPRWAYSAESRTCVEFVYGGCLPTGNNFLTREQCAQTCMSDTPQQCEVCNPPSLAMAYCNSDFVITGIVRRQLFADGTLKTVVLELTRRYKGHNLTLRRSKFLDEPIFIVKSRSQESDTCRNDCFKDLEDGKEYILTGTLSREGGSTTAHLTSKSYVKPVVGRRLTKLEMIKNDRAFNRRCSRRLETPL
ncbi:uncharacterized protein LOC110984004 [Acanthaster planci]|uniref:Uncharacterized protein LOC110984004 n=1 Tax=Acanthaster planci TaxID=133434 RepID=A0A8B7Z3D4_ACAPL|nr:uncharacterized protein LOC110984004 [Acanthaster planci]